MTAAGSLARFPDLETSMRHLLAAVTLLLLCGCYDTSIDIFSIEDSVELPLQPGSYGCDLYDAKGEKKQTAGGKILDLRMNNKHLYVMYEDQGSGTLFFAVPATEPNTYFFVEPKETSPGQLLALGTVSADSITLWWSDEAMIRDLAAKHNVPAKTDPDMPGPVWSLGGSRTQLLGLFGQLTSQNNHQPYAKCHGDALKRR
jgi:hypothetical protein